MLSLFVLGVALLFVGMAFDPQLIESLAAIATPAEPRKQTASKRTRKRIVQELGPDLLARLLGGTSVSARELVDDEYRRIYSGSNGAQKTIGDTFGGHLMKLHRGADGAYLPCCQNATRIVTFLVQNGDGDQLPQTVGFADAEALVNACIALPKAVPLGDTVGVYQLVVSTE